MGLRPVLASTFLGVTLILAWPATSVGFQGQSPTTRPARAANIQTTLAPIRVDFRDIAVGFVRRQVAE